VKEEMRRGDWILRHSESCGEIISTARRQKAQLGPAAQNDSRHALKRAIPAQNSDSGVARGGSFRGGLLESFRARRLGNF